MFIAQAAKWHDNSVFWFKMLMLIIAIVFQFSVRRRISVPAPVLRPVAARLIGGVSLLLWISTAFSAKLMELI
jgi:hypothetical protein